MYVYIYILPVSIPIHGKAFARKAHPDSYLPLKEQVVRTQAQRYSHTKLTLIYITKPLPSINNCLIRDILEQ